MNSSMTPTQPHLLLVEDYPNYLNQMLIELKEDFGYKNIEITRNAQQAKEKLRQSSKYPFDVIITDMRMEKEDSGLEILEEVKAQNLPSKVIVLTAFNTNQDRQQALSLGAWDYFPKRMRGINPFELVHQSIQKAMSDKSKKALEELRQIRQKLPQIDAVEVVRASREELEQRGVL